MWKHQFFFSLKFYEFLADVVKLCRYLYFSLFQMSWKKKTSNALMPSVPFRSKVASMDRSALHMIGHPYSSSLNLIR